MAVTYKIAKALNGGLWKWTDGEEKVFTILGPIRAGRVVDNPRNGVRRAQWRITLRTPDGKSLGESRYSSSLSAEPSPGSLSAFAEAATISNLRNYQTWLQQQAAN